MLGFFPKFYFSSLCFGLQCETLTARSFITDNVTDYDIFFYEWQYLVINKVPENDSVRIQLNKIPEKMKKKT